MGDQPQRFVLGIAYQAGPDPRIKRGMDGGRDFFSKEELEQACWSFMRSGCPQMNAFHVDGTEDCAEPVESFIWRWDDWDVGDGIVVKDGDWCLGAILSPRTWDLHKAGKINGLSPEGTATRRRVRKDGAVPLAKGAADMADDDDDEFSELVNANVPKVALVGQGANGIPRFLISKQAGDALGLIPADMVRELIGKSELQPEPHPSEVVTMSGTPAAIAALIHNAAVRKAEPEPTDVDLAKAKYDAADLKRMAANGQAMKDESYPIADREDLDRAIRAVGRGGAEHDAIRRHVISRAKSLGASSDIPDTWNADGSLKKSEADETSPTTEVTKDMSEMDDGAMDPTVLLAEPEGDAPGSPTEPGSPAWEAIDAATACKWTALLGRALNAIDMLAEREMLEAAGADPDDAENAWDLQDACCAIEYAISILAPFAAQEQAEADCATDAMAALGKALGAFDSEALELVESLGQVRKAGRVLSSANEAAIRGAVESLQKVLASLPAAPTADTDGGQAVAKTANEEPNMAETTASEETTAASGQQPAMGTASPEPKPEAGVPVTEVGKADGDTDGKAPMVAVYDADGNLVGIVDPTEITPIQGAKKTSSAANDDGAEDEDGESQDAAPADDLTPEPAADAGTPADAVVAPATEDDDVTKAANPAAGSDTPDSNTQDLIKAALDAHSATQAELVKGLEEKNQALEERYAQLEKRLADSEERLTTVENQPAVPAILANGVVPPPQHLRGQDNGAPTALTKAQEMRGRFTQATDAVEAARAADEMQTAAIEMLAAMRPRP